MEQGGYHQRGTSLVASPPPPPPQQQGAGATQGTLHTTEDGVLALEARPFRPFKTKDEYLYAMKEDLAEWFNQLYVIDITVDDFFEKLETGVVMCRHANEVQKHALQYLQKRRHLNNHDKSATPRIPEKGVQYKLNVKPGTFQSRDNVSNFITWCRDLGIMEVLLFETEDLVMRKNEKSVILCLLEVARRGAKFGMLAPVLIQMEQEIDQEIAGEAPPDDGPRIQIKTCDLMSLDEMVRDMVQECTCPSQFPVIRVSEGKYQVGDSQTLIFVRVLRNHVMVRVGGGWNTLQNYLDKHDPCRCATGGHVQGKVPPRQRRASAPPQQLSVFQQSRKQTIEVPYSHKRSTSLVQETQLGRPLKKQASRSTIATSSDTDTASMEDGSNARTPTRPAGIPRNSNLQHLRKNSSSGALYDMQNKIRSRETSPRSSPTPPRRRTSQVSSRNVSRETSPRASPSPRRRPSHAQRRLDMSRETSPVRRRGSASAQPSRNISRESSPTRGRGIKTPRNISRETSPRASPTPRRKSLQTPKPEMSLYEPIRSRQGRTRNRSGYGQSSTVPSGISVEELNRQKRRSRSAGPSEIRKTFESGRLTKNPAPKDPEALIISRNRTGRHQVMAYEKGRKSEAGQQMKPPSGQWRRNKPITRSRTSELGLYIPGSGYSTPARGRRLSTSSQDTMSTMSTPPESPVSNQELEEAFMKLLESEMYFNRDPSMESLSQSSTSSSVAYDYPRSGNVGKAHARRKTSSSTTPRNGSPAPTRKMSSGAKQNSSSRPKSAPPPRRARRNSAPSVSITDMAYDEFMDSEYEVQGYSNAGATNGTCWRRYENSPQNENAMQQPQQGQPHHVSSSDSDQWDPEHAASPDILKSHAVDTNCNRFFAKPRRDHRLNDSPTRIPTPVAQKKRSVAKVGPDILPPFSMQRVDSGVDINQFSPTGSMSLSEFETGQEDEETLVVTTTESLRDVAVKSTTLSVTLHNKPHSPSHSGSFMRRENPYSFCANTSPEKKHNDPFSTC